MGLFSLSPLHLVRHSPLVVFHPSSIYDIISLIRSSYASSVPFHIVARGHSHSTHGQAMAPNDVTLNMSALCRNRLDGGISPVFCDPSFGSYVVDVGGEQLWIDVLQATLQHRLALTSWTDYLYLTRRRYPL
ncbi:hypothetical protein K1719_040898 [Acacia pycnantha]|nr:hypothetical protein K1719_040898 [Acacia pycnantha]